MNNIATQTLFRIRIYKKLQGAPDNAEWSNEYDVELPVSDEVENPALQQAVTDITTFEKAIHTWQVEFRRAVISTIEEDDQPSQDGFKTVPVDGFGGRQGNDRDNKALDLGRVLVINFGASSGRQSRHQYRGALDDKTTLLQFGVLSLSGSALPVFQNAAGALAASATGQLLRIVSKKANSFVVRVVSQISYGGVGSRQITSRRKARISLDEDAIINRLRVALKEVSLINASIATKNALGGVPPAKATIIESLVAQLIESANESVKTT